VGVRHVQIFQRRSIGIIVPGYRLFFQCLIHFFPQGWRVHCHNDCFDGLSPYLGATRRQRFVDYVIGPDAPRLLPLFSLVDSHLGGDEQGYGYAGAVKERPGANPM